MPADGEIVGEGVPTAADECSRCLKVVQFRVLFYAVEEKELALADGVLLRMADARSHSFVAPKQLEFYLECIEGGLRDQAPSSPTCAIYRCSQKVIYGCENVKVIEIDYLELAHIRAFCMFGCNLFRCGRAGNAAQNTVPVVESDVV